MVNPISQKYAFRIYEHWPKNITVISQFDPDSRVFRTEILEHDGVELKDILFSYSFPFVNSEEEGNLLMENYLIESMNAVKTMCN